MKNPHQLEKLSLKKLVQKITNNGRPVMRAGQQSLAVPHKTRGVEIEEAGGKGLLLRDKQGRLLFERAGKHFLVESVASKKKMAADGSSIMVAVLGLSFLAACSGGGGTGTAKGNGTPNNSGVNILVATTAVAEPVQMVEGSANSDVISLTMPSSANPAGGNGQHIMINLGESLTSTQQMADIIFISKDIQEKLVNQDISITNFGVGDGILLAGHHPLADISSHIVNGKVQILVDVDGQAQTDDIMSITTDISSQNSFTLVVNQATGFVSLDFAAVINQPNFLMAEEFSIAHTIDQSIDPLITAFEAGSTTLITIQTLPDDIVILHHGQQLRVGDVINADDLNQLTIQTGNEFTNFNQRGVSSLGIMVNDGVNPISQHNLDFHYDFSGAVGENGLVSGTNGNDVVNFSKNANLAHNAINIVGGAGDDTITTGDGDDIIRGGAGRDIINAGGGDDIIVMVGNGYAAKTYNNADLVQSLTVNGAERVVNLGQKIGLTTAELNDVNHSDFTAQGTEEINLGAGSDTIILYGEFDLDTLVISDEINGQKQVLQIDNNNLQNIQNLADQLTIKINSRAKISAQNLQFLTGLGVKFVGSPSSEMQIKADSYHQLHHEESPLVIDNNTNISGFGKITLDDGVHLRIDNHHKFQNILVSGGVINATNNQGSANSPTITLNYPNGQSENSPILGADGHIINSDGRVQWQVMRDNIAQNYSDNQIGINRIDAHYGFNAQGGLKIQGVYNNRQMVMATALNDTIAINGLDAVRASYTTGDGHDIISVAQNLAKLANITDFNADDTLVLTNTRGNINIDGATLFHLTGNNPNNLYIRPDASGKNTIVSILASNNIVRSDAIRVMDTAEYDPSLTINGHLDGWNSQANYMLSTRAGNKGLLTINYRTGDYVYTINDVALNSLSGTGLDVFSLTFGSTPTSQSFATTIQFDLLGSNDAIIIGDNNVSTISAVTNTASEVDTGIILQFSDAEGLNGASFSIANDNRFSINPNNNHIMIKSGVTIDPTHLELQVVATDNLGLSSRKIIGFDVVGDTANIFKFSVPTNIEITPPPQIGTYIPLGTHIAPSATFYAPNNMNCANFVVRLHESSDNDGQLLLAASDSGGAYIYQNDNGGDLTIMFINPNTTAGDIQGVLQHVVYYDNDRYTSETNVVTFELFSSTRDYWFNRPLLSAQESVTMRAYNKAPRFDNASGVRQVISDTGIFDNSATLNQSGQFVASDPDGDIIQYRLVRPASENMGRLELDATNGKYNFIANADAINSLTNQQSAVQTYSVVASDGYLSNLTTIQFNIIGSEEDRAPSITNNIFNFTIYDTKIDDLLLNIGGRISATDPDGDKVSFKFNGANDSGYGTFVLNSTTGAWSFDANEININRLNNGETKNLQFELIATDGSLTDVEILNISIIGVDEYQNFAPIINGFAFDIVDTSLPDIQLDYNGVINAIDNNGDILTYSISAMGAVNYGTMTIYSQTGSFTFDTNEQLVNDLKAGETKSQSYMVTVSDGSLSSSAVIAVNFRGADEYINSAPIITEITGNFIINDTSLADTDFNRQGKITATDPNGQKVIYTSNAQGINSLGQFYLNSETGVWLFDADEATINAIGANQSVNTDFIITASDGSLATSTLLHFQINGADEFVNRAPVITSPRQELTISDSSLSETNLDLNGAISASDPDSQTLNYSFETNLSADYGVFTMDATTGQWIFDANEGAIDGLKRNENKSFTFTIKVSDGALSDGTILVININGADENIAPVFANDNVTFTINDTTLAVESNLNINSTALATDDNGETISYSVDGTGISDFGSMTINKNNGQWTFDANELAINALGADDHPTVQFVIVATDGHLTANQLITINMNGANEPVNIGPVLATGRDEIVITDSSRSETQLDKAGTIIASDVNGDILRYAISGPINSSFGALSFNNSNGNWSFNANESAINGLIKGDVVSLNYVVTVTDGSLSASQELVFTIIGEDEYVNTAPVLANPNETFVINDSSYPEGDLNIGGQIIASDFAEDSLTYQTLSNLFGTFGSMSFDAKTGQWAFDANETAINNLRSGETRDLHFSYAVSDGSLTAQGVVNITINGVDEYVNSAPIMANTSELYHISDTSNTDTDLNIGNQLLATDPNGEALTYTILGDNTSEFGTITIDAQTGQWLFDANEEAINNLNTQETRILRFSVVASDGSLTAMDVLTITIHGANEIAPTPVNVAAPQFDSDFAEYIITDTGDNDQNFDINGQAIATDADGNAVHYILANNGISAFGSFTINSNTGEWHFNANEDKINGLNNGETAGVNTIITATDGVHSTTQTLHFEILGNNETPPNHAPSFLVNSFSVVINDAALFELNFTQFGICSASDSDGDTVTYSVNGNAIGEYGQFSINPGAGLWVFEADFVKINALNNGQSASDIFIITASDGISTTDYSLTFQIKGADENAENFAPVILENHHAIGQINDTSLSEAIVGFRQSLTSFDPNGDTLTYGIVGASSTNYGTMHINSATGEWNFIAIGSQVDALEFGQSQTLSFALYVSDGSLSDIQNFTVNIIGADEFHNHAPVIKNTPMRYILRHNGAHNSNFTLNGTISGTDQDGHSINYSIYGSNSNDYGTLTLTQDDNGVAQWQFTGNDAVINSLTASQSQHIIFTILADDGHNGVSSYNIAIDLMGDDDYSNVAPTFITLPQTYYVYDSPHNDRFLYVMGAESATDANGDALTYCIFGSASNAYGSLTLDPIYNYWKFHGNEEKIDQLRSGDHALVHFSLAVSDGSLTTLQHVTIDIIGVDELNVAPIFAQSRTNIAIYDSSYAEPNLNVAGRAGAVDTNWESLHYGISGPSLTQYGSLTINSQTGEWTFDADETNIDNLNSGESLTLRFTIFATDGSFTTFQSLAVSIYGSDEYVNSAPIFKNISDGQVFDTPFTETNLNISGSIAAIDPNYGETISFSITSDRFSDYGSLSINSLTGAWFFDANERKVSLLKSDESNTHSFAITISDGSLTASHTLNINIFGIDEDSRTLILPDSDSNTTINIFNIHKRSNQIIDSLSATDDVDWVRFQYVSGASYAVQVLGEGVFLASIVDSAGNRISTQNLSQNVIIGNDTFSTSVLMLNKQANSGEFYAIVSATGSSAILGYQYELFVDNINAVDAQYQFFRPHLSVTDRVSAMTFPGEEEFFASNGVQHQFTYYINASSFNYAGAAVTNIQDINRQSVEIALNRWEEVANIQFTSTTNSNNADLYLSGRVNNGADAGTAGFAQGQVYLQTQASVTLYLESMNNPITPNAQANDANGVENPDQYGNFTITLGFHEIAHTLGLGHPSDYNGNPFAVTDAEHFEDVTGYTNMTYIRDGNFVGASYGRLPNGYQRMPMNAMIDDIAFVQQIYGANHNFHSGATHIGFNASSDVSGTVYDWNHNPRPFMAIWDGGGDDVLDFSGFNRAATIDLRGGQFCTGYSSGTGANQGLELVNNIGIAFGANIEAAIGTNFNDRIICLDDDINRRFTGGGGADSYYFQLNELGHTTILDFDSNSGGDKLVFSVKDLATFQDYFDREMVRASYNVNGQLSFNYVGTDTDGIVTLQNLTGVATSSLTFNQFVNALGGTDHLVFG